MAGCAMMMSGCQCSDNGSTGSAAIDRQSIETNVREFVYPLPTAFEVTEMLNRIEAAYIQGICNDLCVHSQRYGVQEVIQDCMDREKGFYVGDGCYTALAHMILSGDDSMSRKLIDGLDMTAAIDPELPEKVERFENNKDELIKLISESFYDSYDYLNKNDRGPISMLVVAGSWIEGLYITTHISDDTFNNKEMVKIVMSQKEPLTKLMELLGRYAHVDYIESLQAELQPIFDIYSQVDEGSITENQLESIKKCIDAVRSKIIE